MGSKPDMMYIAGSGALVGRDSICLSIFFWNTSSFFRLVCFGLDEQHIVFCQLDFMEKIGLTQLLQYLCTKYMFNQY
jgi:hypothetical protein